MIRRDLWCEYAVLPTGIARDVSISIRDDVITEVRTGTPRDGVTRNGSVEPERLAGLTMPGFANSHSHAFHRALRGRTHGGPGDFWTWREQMYGVASRLDPRNYLDLATATFAEMLLAGYTCVGEFHYVHHAPDGTPYEDPNAMGDAVIAAAAQAGIRLTLLDACYLRAGAGSALTDDQRRFGDGTADAWARRVDRLADGPTVRIGAAVHSVRAVDAASIASIAGHADRRAMVLHAHVSEQPAENEHALDEHGCSPLGVFDRAGALSPRFTAVHGTHLGSADIDLLDGSGATCCFCPTTERDLADGIGPSSLLRDAGVPMSIGSDQHAVIDPFEEIRAVEMNERLRSLRRGTHTAAELLTVGAANGYRCLGWDRAGVIDVGAPADLVTVSLGGARLAGADAGALLDAVVFAATSADVTDVTVAGRAVVRDRAHVSIDVVTALRRSIAAVYGEDGEDGEDTEGTEERGPA